MEDSIRNPPFTLTTCWIGNREMLGRVVTHVDDALIRAEHEQTQVALLELI